MTGILTFLKCNAETLKNLAEALALAAGGVFFIYRFVLGYFFVNLSLSLDSDRWRISRTGLDQVCVKCKLSKGDRGSLVLHDARVRVSWKSGFKIVPLSEVDRRSYRTERLGKEERKVVNFDRGSEKSPLLSLTPGEATEFACCVEVPQDVVCLIELVVLGKTKASPWVSQWRASTVLEPDFAKNRPPRLE
jgi:hypothetical protein